MPTAFEEAAQQADAAAVRHEQRRAAVPRRVPQRRQHAALLVGQALAGGKAKVLGVLAVLGATRRLLEHDLREQAALPVAAMRLGEAGVDDERQVAAELLADELGGLAGARAGGWRR